MAVESGPGPEQSPEGRKGTAKPVADRREGIGGRLTRDRRAARRAKVVAFWAVALLVGTIVIVFVAATWPGGDGGGGTAVPPPEAAERADTVVLLEDAYRAQGVCYGWHLQGGLVPRVSVGSNLGDGVDVESDPTRCRRWVKVVADVTYTSESSESNDYASFWVTSSGDFPGIDYDTGLTRLGLSPDAFIDDPGWAVCRAAVFLPLLVAEAGAAPAVPVRAEPSAAPTPMSLPDPGDDFWRDRWGYLVGAGGLFGITVVLLTVGWFERRHQLSAARVAEARAAARAARRPAPKR
ncbi:hypothetical protein BDK92_3452 [Micromonospora pisi]|uniref:Uncharacterized protein n=1 Tax=Micromonospora pisi TaxID=589240 RepID=A0A495JKB4_9ACTN|nr:hypothetical protein [Micromonospora pisi]RKR89115.1 hypothetical protein BDK92_3452 [Micromonospora pisi]